MKIPGLSTKKKPTIYALIAVSPIFEYASGGNLAKIKEILDSGKADLEDSDEEGRTALLWAVDRDQRDVVMELLRRGANINRQVILHLLLLKPMFRLGQ